MTKPSRFWFLNPFERNIKLLKGDCIHLSTGEVVKRFERNAILENPSSKNNCIYWLKDGLVKISTLNNGEENLKYLVHKNQFFGEMALAESEDVKAFATAAVDCQISYFDLNTANRLMEQHSEFRDHMLELISQRVKILESRLEELANIDSRSRVINFLKDLARDFGENQSGKKVVPNFLKNKEIAQLTFTSRQTVNAVMNELKRENYIEFDQKYITFPHNELQF